MSERRGGKFSSRQRSWLGLVLSHFCATNLSSNLRGHNSRPGHSYKFPKAPVTPCRTIRMSNEHPMPPEAAKGRRLLAITIAVTLIGYALFVIYGSIESGFDPRPALVWFIAAGLFSSLWRGKTPARWLLTFLLISIIFTLGLALAEKWTDLVLPGMLFAAAAMLVILAFVPSISAFLRHQRAVIYPPTAAKGRSRLKVALILTFAGAATIPIVELF